jgi:hypothetical protein
LLAVADILENPLMAVSRIVNQTWTFEPGGRLTMSTFGFKKTWACTCSNDALTLFDLRNGRARTMEILSRDRSQLVFRYTHLPGVNFTLERIYPKDPPHS